MTRSRLRWLAEHWRPDPGDPCGEDQHSLVQYLLERSASCKNPVPIDEARRDLGLTDTYSRSAFQHRLLGPLRKRRDVFVGT